MEIATAIDIKSILREKQSDRYYRPFDSMTHLVTMPFGILSRSGSATEVYGGLRGMGGMLNHPGLKKSPAKSIANDGLRNRDSRFFESVYFSLGKHYRSFLSDIRTFGWAYSHYPMLARWTEKQVYFVTRMKKNALYTVKETLRKHYRKKGQAKVLRDEIITVSYHPEDGEGRKITKETRELTPRRVCYRDEKNRFYEFLTNNIEIPAEEVAFLYKRRWTIELLFKKMKQNFRLDYLYRGEYQCHIHAGVMHAHRSAAADCIAEEGTRENGIPGGGHICAH